MVMYSAFRNATLFEEKVGRKNLSYMLMFPEVRYVSSANFETAMFGPAMKLLSFVSWLVFVGMVVYVPLM